MRSKLKSRLEKLVIKSRLAYYVYACLHTRMPLKKDGRSLRSSPWAAKLWPPKAKRHPFRQPPVRQRGYPESKRCCFVIESVTCFTTLSQAPRVHRTEWTQFQLRMALPATIWETATFVRRAKKLKRQDCIASSSGRVWESKTQTRVLCMLHNEYWYWNNILTGTQWE